MINLERRKQILDILSSEGSINTNELSDRLGVTGATIRTDLRDLAREGAIVRFHGGVKLPDRQRDEVTENYMVRSVTNIDLKKKIGECAAKLVRSGDTIFMDASSTAFHMIPFLKDTMDVYILCEENASDMMDASDYLTDQARRFAVTADAEAMDNYFIESDQTKRRDKALASLEKNMPKSQALESLQNALEQPLPEDSPRAASSPDSAL